MWKIDVFIETLARERLSEHTIEWYRRYLTRFVEWCESIGITSPRQVTEALVDRYMHGPIDAADFSPGTRTLIAVSLRRYFSASAQSGEVLYSPASRLAAPRFHCTHLRSVRAETLRRVLDEYPTERDQDLLVKSVLETAYSAGLRAGELRRLQIEEVDFAGGVLHINHAKGEKDRTVPVGKTALHWMKRYLSDVRPQYLSDGADRHVYISLCTGRPFRRTGVGELVARRLRIHRLPHIALHQLRASAATHLVRAGASIAHVQRILGHAEIETTRQYVHLDHDALSQVLAQSHPRAAFEDPRREQ